MLLTITFGKAPVLNVFSPILFLKNVESNKPYDYLHLSKTEVQKINNELLNKQYVFNFLRFRSNVVAVTLDFSNVAIEVLEEGPEISVC